MRKSELHPLLRLASVFFRDDASGDALGQTLPYCRILDVAVFGGAGDESKLAEDGWPLVVPDDIIPVAFNPAALGVICPQDLPENVRRQPDGPTALVIDLDPVGG